MHQEISVAQLESLHLCTCTTLEYMTIKSYKLLAAQLHLPSEIKTVAQPKSEIGTAAFSALHWNACRFVVVNRSTH